jgi:hypothetical protein
VRRGHRDGHGQLAHRQLPGAVHQRHARRAVLRERQALELGQLGLRHALVGVVVEPPDAPAARLVAHAAEEQHHAALARPLHRSKHARDVDGLALHGDHGVLPLSRPTPAE